MKNAIEITGLEKHFSGFQLGPLNLCVPRGAIYGFIGPNGAGKTTTIDLMFGMGNVDSGEIRILDLDHARDEVAVKSRVGYVSPELNFNVWGRIDRALRFVRGFFPTWDDEYCLHLLKVFRLNATDKINALSFGSRTKLSLLIAMAHRPELLILDEPTTGLDAVARQQMFGELLNLVREGDRTVFISSHSLTELERFTDHIGLIKDGRLLLEGRTDEAVERFVMVDFEGKPGQEYQDSEGFTLVNHQSNRWRGLVDKSRRGRDRLEASGAFNLTETPVTLEDLFIALVQEKEAA